MYYVIASMVRGKYYGDYRWYLGSEPLGGVLKSTDHGLYNMDQHHKLVYQCYIWQISWNITIWWKPGGPEYKSWLHEWDEQI